MPLHDHFRGPLALRCPWTSFHAAWATYFAEDLNEFLPERYYALPMTKFGIEIDVATFDTPGDNAPLPNGTTESWSPSLPQLTLPFTIETDVVEVQIFRNEGGPVLVGAVVLVSPSNKDRPEARDAFVTKCAAYLYHGVGLAVVDVVTERRANMHRLLLTRLTPNAPLTDADAELYATAYRPVERDGQITLEVWHEVLALGHGLPTMTLWLRGGFCVPLRLEPVYQRTLQRQRILTNRA
jgi:hypothetical protein